MGEAEEVRRMIDSTHAMSTEHCAGPGSFPCQLSVAINVNRYRLSCSRGTRKIFQKLLRRVGGINSGLARSYEGTTLFIRKKLELCGDLEEWGNTHPHHWRRTRTKPRLDVGERDPSDCKTSKISQLSSRKTA